MVHNAETYSTGVPCVNGHMSPRKVHGNACVECTKAYYRKRKIKYNIRDLHNGKDIAIVNGDEFYETGIPCKYGHLSKRITASSACVQCMIDEKKNRVWRPKKPRALAIEAGEEFYVNGNPCLNGHLAPRVTHTANCTQCQDEKRAAVELRRAAREKAKPKKVRRKRKAKTIIVKKTKTIMVKKQEVKIVEESFEAMAKRLYQEDHKW